MKTTVAALAAVLAAAPAVQASLYGQSKDNHSCVLVPDYQSCSAKAKPNLTDSCCVETYGGLVLLTQFWNTWADKPLPANTWTLHGLWPDFCNGSYTQYCDLNRQYDPVPSPNTTTGLPNGTVVPAYKGPGIGTFLRPFGKYDLLAYMNKYWIGQTGANDDFWGHEFSKHGTCFSTFDLPCYGPQYVKNEDVVDYFETTIGYYKKFPTFDWLLKHGIIPSNSTTYTLSSLENALTEESGAIPYVGCSGPRYNETAAGRGSLDNGRTSVSEVWYYMHTYGRPQSLKSIPVDQTTTSNCVKVAGALNYYAPSSTNGTIGGISCPGVSTGAMSARPASTSSSATSRSSTGTSTRATTTTTSTRAATTSSTKATTTTRTTTAVTTIRTTTSSSKVTTSSSSSSKATTTLTGRPVTQIPDGQIQAPAGTAKPATTSSSSSKLTTSVTGRPVTQITDGQIQAPTGGATTSAKTTPAVTTSSKASSSSSSTTVRPSVARY